MLRNLSISIYQTLFCLYKVLNVKNVPRVLSTTSTTISTLLPLWILCSKNVMNISFDKICTHLLPASANVGLASPKAVLSASTPLVHNLPTSKWTEFISFLPHPPLSPCHQRKWYLHGPGLCPKAADIPRLHYSYRDPCLIILLMVVIKYI